MSSSHVIQLQHVSKKYPIYETSSSRFLELLSFRKWKLHRDFWALRDIDLEIPRGAVLGVLGQNGSGKSTLLQVLAGILRPTTGTCRVEGSVADDESVRDRQGVRELETIVAVVPTQRLGSAGSIVAEPDLLIAIGGGIPRAATVEVEGAFVQVHVV